MSLRRFNQCVGLKTFNTTVICEGCKRTFKGHIYGHKVQAEFKYYVHCTEQCEQFKKLNLIRECKICNLKFLNAVSLSRHMRCVHKPVEKVKIRSWMNITMLNRKYNTDFNSTVNCKGCGTTFKAQKTTKSLLPELDYYIHCVEECEDFKKLNLIRKCNSCNKVYMNKIGYSNHLKQCTSKCFDSR